MSKLSEAERFIEKCADGPCELSKAVRRAIIALEMIVEDSDYCYVCENHPYRGGHGKDCIL